MNPRHHFGINRLQADFTVNTLKVTSIASEAGRSLQDLRQTAEEFVEVFGQGQLSTDLPSQSLVDFVETNSGVVSLHEAFIYSHAHDRMQFRSAKKWFQTINQSLPLSLKM